MSTFRFSLILFVACLFGCDKPRQIAPTSAVLKEASDHIDSFAKYLTTVTNLTTATPADQIASTLRTFGAAIDDWSKDYIMLRAKMIAKGVTEADERTVVEHYRSVCTNSTNVFAQVERSLREHKDAASFEHELEQDHEKLAKLMPP